MKLKSKARKFVQFEQKVSYQYQLKWEFDSVNYNLYETREIFDWSGILLEAEKEYEEWRKNTIPGTV